MHKMAFGKTDTFPNQSAAPGTKRKMPALNALGVSLPSYNRAFMNMVFIGVITVRIDGFYVEWGKQHQQFVQILVFPRAKAICQRNTSMMINGPPQPVLL